MIQETKYEEDAVLAVAAGGWWWQWRRDHSRRKVNDIDLARTWKGKVGAVFCIAIQDHDMTQTTLQISRNKCEN